MGNKGENSPLGVTWGMEIQNHRRNSNVWEERNMNDSPLGRVLLKLSTMGEKSKQQKSSPMAKTPCLVNDMGKILMPWAYRSPTTKS